MKVLIGFCILAVAFAARPDVPKTCTEKPESGMCMALFRMWYYDPETESCKKFIYGGCQGNGNRYRSEEECLDNCKGVTVEQQLSEVEVDCDALPESGMCDAYMPRFYYNSLEGQCKKFIYGGCGGNTNNFRTEEECINKCRDNELEAPMKFPFSCDCESGNSTCACCGQLFVPKMNLDQKACVDVSYISEKKALQVAIRFNKRIVYNNTISATNPPPVCVGPPQTSFFADVCFDFYDIDVSLEKIHFCLNVKPRILKNEIGDFKAGCFTFNRGNDESKE